jgi:hypothetical protein
VHVLDGWQHLVTVEPRECEVPLGELARSAATRQRPFEYDEYRILTRMLRDPRLRACALAPAAPDRHE